MDSDVTYADLKFPIDSKETGIKKDSQTHDKKKSPQRLLIALVVVIGFLLATVTALIILYALLSARLLQTEQRVKSYMKCAEPSSDSDCREFVHQSCPEGWVLNNSRCYFFSNETSTWNDSRGRCMLKASDLVIISGPKEQVFITETKSSDFFWIGLTDEEHEGHWKWVDGSILQSENFWGCGQPDDSNKQEDCATVGLHHCSSKSILHSWNDDSCPKHHRYICEKQVRREFIF